MRCAPLGRLEEVLHLPHPGLAVLLFPALTFCQEEVAFLLGLRNGLVYTFLVGFINDSIFHFTQGDTVADEKEDMGVRT